MAYTITGLSVAEPSTWVNKMEVCCYDPEVRFYSERRHRFRMIKEFRSAEESGPGKQMGDQLPRKVRKLVGSGGQVPRAEGTKVRGELEGYEVVIRR